jgi:proprotein convertase subtilisin/kexin type 5
MFQGNCVQVCPANSNRNTNSGICVCSPGFLMSGLNACVSVCAANSAYDASSASCFCNANYQMVSGVCQPCNQNQAYDQTSRTCVAKFVGKVGTSASVVNIVCQPNEIVVNNACQCDQNSIKVGSKCSSCPVSTYKLDANQCGLCSSYCKSCTSNTSCTQCNTGFQIIGQ